VRRILQVRKRDGRLVPFRREKIADAIFRAARSVGGEDRFLAEELAGVVVMLLERGAANPPGIEEIQDAVERVLIETGHARTAKAFILYRDRRAQVRAARPGTGARTLVGGQGLDAPVPFEKAGLAAALVAQDGLEVEEAEDVARHVEEQLLAAGLPRVSAGLVGALARCELFRRGRESRLDRDPDAAALRARAAAWLSRGRPGRRLQDPADLARALGEEVLAEHVLAAVVPRAAAEAHRQGDLHLYDAGHPVALTAVCPPVPRVFEEALGEGPVGRAGAPRRAADALAEVVRRYAPYAARCLAIEAVNVLLAPAWADLDEDALAEEAHLLLRSPVLAAFPGRGGALELEFGLAAEAPAHLACRDAPPPAAPGRTWGDHADASLRIARALVGEAASLRRSGFERGPRWTLAVPREGARDAAARALLKAALSAAADTGEPRLAFEHPGLPRRGSRWLRLGEAESLDPLRFAEAGCSVATVAALNLVAGAIRAGPGGEAAFLSDLDRLVALAADAAMARRGLLERQGDEPGRMLYAIGSGPVPRVDLGGAAHLFEPVGLERAVERLQPDPDEAARAALRQRVFERLEERVAAEAVSRGLFLRLAEGLTGEPAHRFARLDAARYEVAAAWWPGDLEPSYESPPPETDAPRRDRAWTDPTRRTAGFLRLRHRVSGERRPPLGDLLQALESAAADAAVVEYALEPWPRRFLRSEAGPP
jgi:hypothetical protein